MFIAIIERMEGEPKFQSGFNEGVEDIRRTFTYLDTSDPANPETITFDAMNIPEADQEYERRTGKKLDMAKGTISRSFIKN